MTNEEQLTRARARQVAEGLTYDSILKQRIYRALLDFHRDGVSEGLRMARDRFLVSGESLATALNGLCDLIAKHERGEG